MSNLAVAILAAGASSRMGRPKQHLTFRGKTLIQNAVDIALKTGCRTIFLVVNSAAQSLLSTTQERVLEANASSRVIILVNELFTEGIASSIRIATEAARAYSEIDGLLFLNCDQPLLSDDGISGLIRLYAGGKIVASSFGGVIGSPAIFDRIFFPELSQLNGDVGAKSVIKNHHECVIECVVENADFDVDTPADYQALLAISSQGG